MTGIARSDDVRRQNRRLVLAELRQAGRLSRTEICARTGLSPATVSAITSSLMTEGFLREERDTDAAAQRRGRPQIALGLDPAAACVATLVLSLNRLSGAIVDYAGNVVVEHRERLATLELPRAALLAAVTEMLRRLVGDAASERRRILRIAFAIQGITDSSARSLLWSPITPHVDIDFADLVEKEFGLPVTVENDCNMIAVALQARNPERYGENFVVILLSHGIGMGLVLKGRMFTGTHSSGGEFGHMNHQPDGALCRCGRRGCIEAYAGNYAIWRNARGFGEDAPPVTDLDADEMKSLADAARASDGPEREAYRRAGEALGFGLGNLFALFDPAPVAIVGGGAVAFDLIENAMHAAIAKTAAGQHHPAVQFEMQTDEKPLIRDGCARHALVFVDREIVAPGEAGRAVA